MARVRKPQPTQDCLFFSTPEQRVLRLLLSNPTTSFQPRVISSKLKGVRGLGGADGIMKILLMLETLGLVHFVDNRRAVRLHDDHPTVQHLKVLVAICDLEGIRALLEPICKRLVLIGSRASGQARTDSNYNLVAVSDSPEQVTEITRSHPMGKDLATQVVSSDTFQNLEKLNKDLAQLLTRGIVLWGSTW